jgi:hypothetical protein
LRLRIVTTTFLDRAHYHRGEYGRVVELATENLAALPADWVYEYFGASTPPSVFDRSCLVMSLAQLGRFAEAWEHEAEAIRLAETTLHPFTVGHAHRAASVLHLLRGDWAKARSLIEHRIAVLRTGDVVLLLPDLVASSAWILAGSFSWEADACPTNYEVIVLQSLRSTLARWPASAPAAACSTARPSACGWSVRGPTAGADSLSWSWSGGGVE